MADKGNRYDETRCRKCGREAPIDALDAKPEITPWFLGRVMRYGQPEALVRAADVGLDFTRLECARCYGPGFAALAA